MSSKRERRQKRAAELQIENRERAKSGLPNLNMKQFRAKRQKERGRAASRPSFYQSETWKRLRYEALRKYEGRCMCCGASPEQGATLRVDHIKSIRRFPELKADPSNLQVLCNDCNWGKGGDDSTDWRSQDPRYGEIRLIANDGRSV